MQTPSPQHAPAAHGPSIGRQFSCRPALTLVELLVTISIIAILAGLFLGALQLATNDAKVMKTKSMIAKLNNLIMPRYEAYRTRRVPIQITNGTSPATAAKYRVDGLHDLMRMEMPDRMTDITDPPITFTSPPTVAPSPIIAPTPAQSIARPALSQAYYQALVTAAKGSPPVVAPASGWTINTTNQGAECLYLIVTLGFVDELGGRDLFNESNVGDTDGDGLSELLDAWGTPIGFLRWAPGFTESELNGAGGTLNGGAIPAPATVLTAAGSPPGPSSYGLARRSNAYIGKTITVYTPATSMTAAITQVATISSSIYNVDGTTTLALSSPGLLQALQGNETFGIDPDPFDPAHAYPISNPALPNKGVPFNAVPFALYPLIYSAGPDKTFGVLSDFGNTATTQLEYSILTANGTPTFPNGINNYPFLTDTVSSDSDFSESIGTTKDLSGEQTAVSGWVANGWIDNIHNHLIGLK